MYVGQCKCMWISVGVYWSVQVYVDQCRCMWVSAGVWVSEGVCGSV